MFEFPVAMNLDIDAKCDVINICECLCVYLQVTGLWIVMSQLEVV